MDKQSAAEIIRKTFENPFEKEQFIYFVKNLFNNLDETKAFHARGYVKEKYKKAVEIIKTYERIGSYADPEGKKIDALIVYLNKKDSIERARTTLRNFVADYLKTRGEKDAALVAFVSPNPQDWRFSLVKMDYRFEEGKHGKIRIKEEFTSARRWSFLVGENEPNHTAQQQLIPLLQDDINNPTLDQLEKAFSIEKVTKEFLNKYRGLYLQLKESMDKILSKDKAIKEEFERKEINTINFCKKLLGQIVFLYFLQKKGWLGVPQDKNWGEGDKNFLRSLFNKCDRENKNFFNDYLEFLFYDALNNEHRGGADSSIYPRFNCKIPFLNGGLFEPINNYNWKRTDIVIPDTLFSNTEKTKEGDIGSGILDIFDRFNFTVREDEPLEKEVALDPELLGKVFENLIEENLRKGQGAYYTPREIVHYMCQQSLINYLYTELNQGTTSYETLGEKQLDAFGNTGKQGQNSLVIEHGSSSVILKEDIEILIKYGDIIIEHDKLVITKKEENLQYKYKKMQIPETIKDNAKLIDDKLKNIRVCDPAVGSGAFPIGMLLEIIKARNVLTNYICHSR
ncbi:MAG: class I SAM-dependent DNA methyltransferase, partial [Candidatus Omnitrophica bacterium]|nr:class I SAM-dependent DNA methyltransferase [Candidatus Omnitrophota bacterium]